MPISIGEVVAAPLDADRSDCRPGAAKRKNGLSLNQFNCYEVAPPSSLHTIVVHEQSVWLGSGENEADIVRGAIQRREGHVGQLLEAVRRLFAMPPVPSIDAGAFVAGVHADTQTAVQTRIWATRIGEQLAVAAPVPGSAKAKERGTVGIFPARSTVLTRMVGAYVAFFGFAVPTFFVGRADTLEVEALSSTLTTGFARIRQAGVLSFVAVRSRETVGALAIVFVQDQRRSEDNILTVRDFGGLFDVDRFGTYTAVFAGIFVARSIPDL